MSLNTPSTTEQEYNIEEFARYEFKYLLNREQQETIESEVSHFMNYDGHVHPELENSYFVRSLYFDNPWAGHYYDKIDGIKARHKFRLRTYARNFEPGLPIYLEKKGRHNERTYKQRVEIAYDDLYLFQDPASYPRLLDRFSGLPLVEQFVFEGARRDIRPAVLVDYQRRPYTSAFDMNFRLTFDFKLVAAKANTLFPTGSDGAMQGVAGWTILEVKFHRRIPAWFHRILQAHDMRRLPISKFCIGMQVCGLAVNLS